MKTFSISLLPKDVRSKIDEIVWDKVCFFCDGILGSVWLKPGYVFNYAYETVTDFFVSRKDLITKIRNDVIKRKEE